jgi:Fe-S-cluster containining protein
VAENPEQQAEKSVAAVMDMVDKKRRKYGEKYDRFIAAVAGLLRAEFPQTFGPMPDEQLSGLISFVDALGEDSQNMMKRLKEACTGCGWCCSETAGVIVSAEDAERISRQLKQKKDDLFALVDGAWMIRKGHPCQWWNGRTGRCRIYNIRPKTCRTWPTLPNESGQSCLHPVAECAYAVRVMAIKVLDSLKASQGMA